MVDPRSRLDDKNRSPQKRMRTLTLMLWGPFLATLMALIAFDNDAPDPRLGVIRETVVLQPAAPLPKREPYAWVSFTVLGEKSSTYIPKDLPDYPLFLHAGTRVQVTCQGPRLPCRIIEIRHLQGALLASVFDIDGYRMYLNGRLILGMRVMALFALFLLWRMWRERRRMLSEGIGGAADAPKQP